MAREDRQASIVEQRKERVPFGGPRQRLYVPAGIIPQDKVGRWFNDTADGRIQRALAAGYEFLRNDGTTVSKMPVDENRALGSYICRTVGENLTAYLMVIDKAYYEQDQRAKQKSCDDFDAAIKRGQVNRTPGDGLHVPSKGIDYRP